MRANVYLIRVLEALAGIRDCEEFIKVTGVEDCKEAEEIVREIFNYDIVTRCKREGNRVLCIYHYSRRPEWNPLSVEARGVVVEWKRGVPKLLAYPFHKFFNVNEVEETSVERLRKMRPIKAFEKVDGTLIIAFYDPEVGAFRTATRRRLDSPFAKIAEGLLPDLKEGYTYMFELLCETCGSVNVGEQRPVKAVRKLIPLARRDMSTLSLYPLNGPKEYEVKDLDEAFDIVKDANFEGLVLWYEVGVEKPLMVKVKSKKYLELVETLKSDERLAGKILRGEVDDVLPFLEEGFREVVLSLLEVKDEICKNVRRIKGVEDWLSLGLMGEACVEAIKACLKERRGGRECLRRLGL